jgi:hypothetical protein
VAQSWWAGTIFGCLNVGGDPFRAGWAVGLATAGQALRCGRRSHSRAEEKTGRPGRDDKIGGDGGKGGYVGAEAPTPKSGRGRGSGLTNLCALHRSTAPLYHALEAFGPHESA